LNRNNFQIERDADFVRGSVNWQPDTWRWPVFGILFGLFSGLLWFMTELEGAIAFSPLVAYVSAAMGFNRTVVRIDSKRVEWKERPFPLRRQRKLKLDEIDAWAYGKTPASTKSSSSSSSTVTYSVAILRTNGKIMRVVDSLSGMIEARDIALQLASYSNLPVKQPHSLRGPANPRKGLWVAVAILILFAAVVAMVIWSASEASIAP
jgi:hypothetical protein